MSNGKSKIAFSKAALCCGFAIALRALFIGDSLLVDCFGYRLAMTQDYRFALFLRHCERAHRASEANNRVERSKTLDCFEQAPQ